MKTNQKKCSIVEVRTTNQDTFVLFKYGEGDYSIEFQRRPASMINLYVLSDDKIEQGDMVYINGQITQIINITNFNNYFIHKDEFKKVIATTDFSIYLPAIPKAFLGEYCKVGGIKEVMIDYINKCQVCGAEQYYNYCHYPNATGCCGGKCIPIPQLNSKSELILSRVKDTWTKSEVISILKQSCKDLWFEDSNSYKDLDNWIEENL